MNIAQTRRRAVAVAMGIAVVGALAACSDDSNDASDDTAAPETVTETVTAGQDADQMTSQNDPAQTTGAAPAQGSGSGSVSTLVFNGNDSAAQFPNVQCRQDDDGELEIELRGDTRGDGVDIDLDLRGEPRVEGLSVDLDRVEWESTDAQEREATVEVDGDTYRVNGQVQIDDDDPNAGGVADLEAEVSCA
ncbi:lipoprotein LpqH [Corynebacterium kalidii]|uniref:Lipoprotein LpqH n=1 Tax=Corynebacterium kalidii TaxID=2931982 RepID=A0A9X1WF92_9CORY|nr:lipoprotein LpqH [Corynebacterium kalidii]